MFNEFSDEIINKMKEGLDKKIGHFKGELSVLKVGRANANILNKVYVDYFGTSTPISQVANISVPEARLLVISPWDASLVKDITKAIMASDIGITPNDDGRVIRLNFPALTEERRREVVKDVKKMGEEAKIAVRNERRDCLDGMKRLEKDKKITEDDLEAIEKNVQKEIDKTVALIDSLVSEKEKEIMSV